MESFTLPPLKRYKVIIVGPLDVAVTTAGYYSHHPLRNVKLAAGRVFADIFITRADLSRWYALKGYGEPGALTFFLGS